MRLLKLSLVLALGVLASACSVPERSRNLGDANVSGTTLAQQVCIACHGVTGVATSPNFPSLAGQPAGYTAGQLRAFRGQSRSDPAGFEYMWGLAHRLTDKQIDELAAYYAGQKAVAPPVEGDAARIEAGRVLFSAGVPDKAVPACGVCHGEKATGSEMGPRLATQHADYLEKQLGVFQRTDQRPEGSVMKTIAHGLDEEQIRNLAAYLQSLTE